MIFITILLKKINAELLFTETDSLTYEIKSENVYKEFFKWKDLFNLSLIIIQIIQSFLMRLIKKLLVK